MRRLRRKIAAILAVATAVCHPQTVAISGVVMDRAGAGIDSASVLLRKAGLATTTGPDGSFTLSGRPAIARNGDLGGAGGRPRLTLNGTRLTAFTNGHAAMTVRMYTCDGRMLLSRAISVFPGANAINLSRSSEALHIVRASVDGTYYTCRSVGAAAVTLRPWPREGGVEVPAGMARVSAGFVDEIEVRKAGQLVHRVGVTDPDTTGIRVVMVPSAGEVSDVDGNVYQTVRIGNQIWTAENLRTTRHNDGTPIPLVTDNVAWARLSTPGYCWYGNDTGATRATYGAMYNGHAVHAGRLAPQGWHVSTDAEWGELAAYLGGDAVAGGMLKEAGTMRWDQPNIGADNATGFSALPGGCRMPGGTFSSICLDAGWWTTTARDSVTGWYRALYTSEGRLDRDYDVLRHGFYVRCVKD